MHALFLEICYYTLLFFMSTGVLSSLQAKENQPKKENPSASPAPWTKPRELSSFQSLLSHSPFSLATAEESSPLGERYAITGIITLDGEEEIFVLDKNDQSRELLTKKPNKKSMSLLNIIHEKDPTKLKATILVSGETGVITSPEPNTNNSTMGAQQHFGESGFPNNGNNSQKNMFHPSGTPYYPGGAAPNQQHSPGVPYYYPTSTSSNLPHPPLNSSSIPSTVPPNSNPSNHHIITRPPIPTHSIPPSLNSSSP